LATQSAQNTRGNQWRNRKLSSDSDDQQELLSSDPNSAQELKELAIEKTGTSKKLIRRKGSE